MVDFINPISVFRIVSMAAAPPWFQRGIRPSATGLKAFTPCPADQPAVDASQAANRPRQRSIPDLHSTDVQSARIVLGASVYRYTNTRILAQPSNPPSTAPLAHPEYRTGQEGTVALFHAPTKMLRFCAELLRIKEVTRGGAQFGLKRPPSKLLAPFSKSSQANRS